MNVLNVVYVGLCFYTQGNQHINLMKIWEAVGDACSASAHAARANFDDSDADLIKLANLVVVHMTGQKEIDEEKILPIYLDLLKNNKRTLLLYPKNGSEENKKRFSEPDREVFFYDTPDSIVRCVESYCENAKMA